MKEECQGSARVLRDKSSGAGTQLGHRLARDAEGNKKGFTRF